MGREIGRGKSRGMGRGMGEVRQAKSSLPPFLAYSMCLRLDFDKGAACHAKTAAIYCLLSSTIFRKYFTIYEFLLCLVPLLFPFPLFVLFMLLAFDAAYELLATTNGSDGSFNFPP